MKLWQNTYCVHRVTKPHRIQTSQHHSNLPVGICGDGGEGIPHNGEKRPTPCHHLLNERKVTPLALPCNHGDGNTVFHMYRYLLFHYTSWHSDHTPPFWFLPWEQMRPPGLRAAFIFSKYGFSNRHLAGPVRGYHYQTAIVAVQLVYNGPFCKLYSPLSPLPQSLLPPFLPFLLTLLSFLISLVPRLLRYDASAAMSSPMGSEESVMITSNCPAHCCMNSAPSWIWTLTFGEEKPTANFGR